jgi:Serine carboxypeptidase
LAATVAHVCVGVEKGGLMDNPYSWTHAGVNLMALEAPIGVGYSYCSKQMDGEVCKNTDDYTASASGSALEDFFINKFPEFRDNDFYITGESYAGVYIPTLSRYILEKSKIAKNLKAIAVGDPCTDNVAQADSMDPLWYSNKYGLMDEEIYDVLWNECETWFEDRHAIRHKNFPPRSRNGHQSASVSSATSASSSILRSLPHGPWANHAMAALLNVELRSIQNIKDRHVRAHELYQEHVLGVPALNGESLPLMGKGNPNSFDDHDTKCSVAYRKFLLSSSHALSQGWKDLFIDDYSLFAPVTSIEDQQMAAYMNRDDVKKALHVEETPIESWPYPNAGFDYTKEYNACNWQDPSEIRYPDTSMVDIYQDIVPKLDHTWIYNGDTDPCVSYEGEKMLALISATL